MPVPPSAARKAASYTCVRIPSIGDTARPANSADRAALTAAYARYRAGELPADELPDLADIFPDDQALRGDLRLEAHWLGDADLDLALVDPDGHRVSWLGAPPRGVNQGCKRRGARNGA